MSMLILHFIDISKDSFQDSSNDSEYADIALYCILIYECKDTYKDTYKRKKPAAGHELLMRVVI